MAIESIPIPAPLIDARDGEQLAAEAIARVNAACPELTNNNPGSPHTALAENMAWHVEQVLYAINRLPDLVRIEFARLFGIELRLATKATATLTFTVAPPSGSGATIPAGTRVSTGDGKTVFETTAALELAPGVLTGEVAASCTVSGPVQLATGTLTKPVAPVAWVTAVTNADVVDSGSEQETVASALERARNYQQRAERIVSARDLEKAIVEDIMLGNAVIRVFEKTEDGFWDVGDFARRVGNTTVVLMTKAGNAISTEVRHEINSLLTQLVGNQNVFIKDPVFHDFNIAVNVRLTDASMLSVARAAAEASLRAFFAVKTSNFGRAIRPSEIIQLIEGTTGVDAIVPFSEPQILVTPAAVIPLAVYELPRLGTVTLTPV